MRDALLQFYHRLPSPLRSVAASLRGFQLKRWRYGSETEQLVEEALSRESWGPEQWEIWQQQKRARLLHRAATRVPYYREQWSARRRAGDTASWTELQNWPVLEKDSVRASPKAFVADDCDVRAMFCDQTSGTSGKPLALWFQQEAVRQWYALFEARLRVWNGVSRHDRWAILGGQLVVPASADKPPFWVWNAPMRQLYLSSFHLMRENTPAYVHALHRYRVTHVVGYSSSLTTLSRDILELGLDVNGPKVVLTNAEPLFPWQRAVIEQAFNAKVRESYGMAEAVMAGSECRAGRLHLWPEAGCLETLNDDEDTPVADGEVGRFVCTGLINDAMPLVRYSVGDRGSVCTKDEVCSCGRRLPVISTIEGRTNDMITTPDGRRVYWLNSVFYGLPLTEAQIVQEKLDLVRVKLVPNQGFSRETTVVLTERLKMRLGDVKIMVESVNRIPRSANGKFRAVLSHVHRDDLPQIEEALSS
jgi:phenylacetate-CoA ligase